MKNFRLCGLALLVVSSLTLGCGSSNSTELIEQPADAEQQMEDYAAAIEADDADRQ